MYGGPLPVHLQLLAMHRLAWNKSYSSSKRPTETYSYIHTLICMYIITIMVRTVVAVTVLEVQKYSLTGSSARRSPVACENKAIP